MVPEKIQRELHINSGQLHFVIAINLKGRYANIHGVKVPWGINGSHGAKAGRIKVCLYDKGGLTSIMNLSWTCKLHVLSKCYVMV